MKTTFAFTLAVPRGCVMSEPDDTDIIRYRDLNSSKQENFLFDLLNVAFRSIVHKDSSISYIYENHKDGSKHMHGTLYDVTSMDCRRIQMSINDNLGYSIDNPKLFFYKKLTDAAGWDAYCKKVQPKDSHGMVALKWQTLPAVALTAPTSPERNKPLNKSNELIESDDETLYKTITEDIFRGEDGEFYGVETMSKKVSFTYDY